MKLEWLGRYRELVRSLVYFSNSSNKAVSARRSPDALNQYEYQTLEYIVEFENENKIMADISRDLGILPSTITKVTKKLVAMGCVQRFRLSDNKKNILLKPTEKGKETYIDIYSNSVSKVFTEFFEYLKDTSDEQLEEYGNAVRILSDHWGEHSDKKLVEIKSTKE